LFAKKKAARNETGKKNVAGLQKNGGENADPSEKKKKMAKEPHNVKGKKYPAKCLLKQGGS